MIINKENLENNSEKITETGCWIWMGAVNKDGYGRLHGDIKTCYKDMRAHRASYETFIGDIPDEMYVLHTCDVPPCINPFHLFTGTQQDNIADRDAKSRTANTENKKHYNAVKTHCPHGHEYTEQNTRWYKGFRSCKTCMKIANSSRKERG